MNEQDVINMRRAMGTLPSQSPKKTYSYKNDVESMYVKMTDWPRNPYEAIGRAVCATWGDNETGSTGKWEKLTPENRSRVVLSALTGNTLPQALENLNFQFEVNGISRSDFDQHARARIGFNFESIGTRDNNKLDADFLLYNEVIDQCEKDFEYKQKVENWVKLTKDLYEETINLSDSSWQTGRCFLPQSVNHSYVFGCNYLALKGQMSRRLAFCEQEGIVALHWKIKKEVEDKFPLLANYFKPACDNAKRCVYMSGPEGMTKYFSNLFDGCGRWESTKEDDKVYKEFNHSCTNYERLKQQGVPVRGKEYFINFTENDYEKLSDIDKKYFEN